MYFEILGTQTRLMGTMHYLPKGEGDLPFWIWDAFTWAETIILESDNSVKISAPLGPFALSFIKTLTQTADGMSEGVEAKFRVRNKEKCFAYLETMDDAVGLMNLLPDSHAKYLQRVYSRHNAVKRMHRMFDAWKVGNLSKVEAIDLTSPESSMLNVRHFMLTTRNERWMPRIIDQMNASTRGLIAVGCGHLPGENGLVQMLCRAGYELRKLDVFH
jgi:uncharacterized protein YbaP (TraB family)